MSRRVSVALASYNGAEFICDQVASILANLGKLDELVISDDGSTDGTVELLQTTFMEEGRIVVLRGPREGIIANFENALRACRGRFIFLSDQDDLWRPGKVDAILALFDARPELTCVVHDVDIIDSLGRVVSDSYFGIRRSGRGLLRNLARNSYLGAAMAFRADLLATALPIPRLATMHDQWIGLNSELFGASHFEPARLGSYRRHDRNHTELNSPGSAKLIVQRRIRMGFFTVRQIVRHAGRQRDRRRPA